jgi:hypothetical protein
MPAQRKSRVAYPDGYRFTPRKPVCDHPHPLSRNKADLREAEQPVQIVRRTTGRNIHNHRAGLNR